ncbi:hypothetical protein COCMIDRAFT_39838 [Bipolaris oryzae ATCC 44560]|uniref:Uncharacterized protein n=1 Tax=Bipolaris oryzae ATCC 44560 TaxID=930090 RepID=W6YRJ7_COCMI|nr:uncharacterized protein COCMIDRAFT_39838 [Bipolaris oryzae ATCC 44560]EUC42077.1 hypothetical protein COCMIDRAFT_39838 [Bipolaris oryzae ATCC 44560]
MGTGAESPGLSCPLDVDLFPAYSDDSPLCDCSFAHLLLALIVRRDQVLMGIGFPWGATSRTCRCRCLCMESTWIRLRLCACSATICLGWTLSCLYSVLIRWHSRFVHVPLAVAFALYATALFYSIPF